MVRTGREGKQRAAPGDERTRPAADRIVVDARSEGMRRKPAPVGVAH